MLSSRAGWFLVVVVLMQVIGAFVIPYFSVVPALVGITLLAWFSYEWAMFQTRSNAAVSRLRVTRHVLQGGREVPMLWSGIAFEVREAELMDLDDTTADVLGSLVDLGFHLCIDGLRNFDVDAAQLAEGGVRFVKIEAAALMPAISDEGHAVRLRRLKSSLDAAGIDLVVANIANEQLLVELLDFDIEFGQGPLFGEARKVRDARVPPAEGRRERM